LYIGDYSLRLTFADGVVGDIDLRDELWGPVFEPLRDIELFKRFSLLLADGSRSGAGVPISSRTDDTTGGLKERTRMATDEAIKSPDEVSATLEQAYYDLMTEARLARVGLKERQETAPIVARYEALYTKRQIEALRGEMERAGDDGERREELTRLHNALLEGYVEARVAALDDEVVSSFAAATAEVDGETYPFHALRTRATIT